MQIRESNDFDPSLELSWNGSTTKETLQRQLHHRESLYGVRALETGEDWPVDDTLAFTELLDVELEPGQCGLSVLRIGKESPFCRLRPLGSYTMKGLLETGDRIVAIDGVLSHKITDLARIAANRRYCEIAIYDHRTRLTVSWQISLADSIQVA